MPTQLRYSEEEARKKLIPIVKEVQKSAQRILENLEGIREDIRNGKFPPPQPPYKERDIIQDLF